VYVEGFGPGTGSRFLTAVERCVAAGKTVVVQKVGRTAIGADAARSHTASMSGSYAVFESVMLQAGALVATSDEEFLDLSRLASVLADRKPNGNNLFVIKQRRLRGSSDRRCGRRRRARASDAARDGASGPLHVHPHQLPSRHARPGQQPSRRRTDDAGHRLLRATKAALADPLYDMALVAITPHGNAMRGTLHRMMERSGSARFSRAVAQAPTSRS